MPHYVLSEMNISKEAKVQVLAAILEYQELLEHYRKHTKVFCVITSVSSASVCLNYSLNLKALITVSLQKCIGGKRSFISCGEAYKIHRWLAL